VALQHLITNGSCLGSNSGEFDDRQREKSSVHVHTTPSSITCRNIINPLTGSEERGLLQGGFFSLAPGQHSPLAGIFADAPC